MPVKKSTRSSKPKASSENAEEPTVDSKKNSPPPPLKKNTPLSPQPVTFFSVLMEVRAKKKDLDPKKRMR